MNLGNYYTEMMNFKLRQLRLLGRADKALEAHAYACMQSPEVAVIDSPNMFQYAAMRKVALTFLDQIGLYEKDSGPNVPLGIKPERFFNMFYKQCENELVARSKTPRDKTIGEQLFYDALREHYADELVYLSSRKNFLERRIMSHNSGYRPIAQSPNKGSSWSDHGIDQSEPTIPSAKLHAIAHDIARLEAELQHAVALLERARALQFATDGLPDDLDDEVVAFINKHKA